MSETSIVSKMLWLFGCMCSLLYVLPYIVWTYTHLIVMLSKVMYHAITNLPSIHHVLVYYIVGLNAGIFIAAFRPGDMQAGIRLFMLIYWR